MADAATKVNQVVCPGDALFRVAENEKVKIGHGLMQTGSSVSSMKAGILRYQAPGKYYLESNQKRYVPAPEDMVIGVVTDRLAEAFKVDIGGAHVAQLPALAFENATRRNRPDLKVGSVVYARLTVADRDMEPELACMAASGKAQGFGELEGGYLFSCSLGLSKALMDPDCVVLTELGSHLPFEIAVGANGRVWVKANLVSHSILLANAVLNSELLTAAQCRKMVRRLVEQASQGS
eukprot:tig00000361_g24400.t1